MREPDPIEPDSDVDEADWESFPSSDPPSSWASAGQTDDRQE